MWHVTGIISPSGTYVVINLKANVRVNIDSKPTVIQNGRLKSWSVSVPK